MRGFALQQGFGIGYDGSTETVEIGKSTNQAFFFSCESVVTISCKFPFRYSGEESIIAITGSQNGETNFVLLV